MKVNYSISTKVVIILFFSILASMTLSGIFSYIFERQKMIKNSEESVEQISNSLIYNLANPMWNYDEISVNDIIDLEIKNSILSALIIRDESDSVSYMRVKDADKNIVNYAPFDLDKKQFYKIVKGEIKYKHETVGYVTLYFNNSILSDRLSTSIIVIILQVLLVSFIAISILFFSLKKSFLEPVIVINNAVEKFAKKDFNARINYKSEDEIGHLAESFNNMASTLQLYSETMEAIVEERTKELVQSEKMASLGGLVAGIAHEINTPVGIAVTASSHLLKKTGDFTELYKNNLMKRSDLDGYIEVADESTQLILNNLEKASSLIQSFKQVAVDQSSEEKRTFRIKEYIEDVLVSLKPKLKRHNHNITIESDDNIEIDSFPGAFSQIVTNLVINSLIHAFDDGQNGNIKFAIKKDKYNLTIVYSDDGKGIPKENVKKIFEPFFTTKRNQGGSGLGMHIIYNIVTQKLSGKIDCETGVNKGVVFTITIPLYAQN